MLAVLLSACEAEEKIYTGGEGTLVGFEQTTYNLEINIDDVGELRAKVNVSTASPETRTFNVNVVADPEVTTAIAGSYNVPATVTIPANSYSGEIVITGTDVAGVDTDPLTLVIELEEGASFSTGPRATITVNQVCPIPPTYLTGNYQITNLATRFGRPLIETKVAAITSPSPTSRRFTNKLLGMTTDSNVTLNLVCNMFVLSEVSTNLSCQPAAAPPVITYGPATNNSTYNLSDDSTFIINFNFDINASCANNGAWVNQSFIMTKIP